MAQKSAEERLGTAAKRMIYSRECTCYGLVLMGVSKHVTTSTRTFKLTKSGIHKVIQFNPDFVQSLEPDHLFGMYIHELLHIMHFHPERMQRLKNQSLANLAADLVVNQHINRNYLPNTDLPLDEFRKKVQQWEDNGKQGVKPVRPIFPQDLNIPADPKLGIVDYYEMLSGNQTGLTQEELEELADLMEMDDHEPLWEPMDEIETELQEKQTEYMLRRVMELEEFQKNRGTLPGSVQELLKRLEEPRPPVVNWRAMLRGVAGTSSRTETKQSRRRPSHRHPTSPRIKVIEERHILFAIDTSGSVSNKELQECFQELDWIHDAGVQITVVQADTAISNVSDYENLRKDKIEIHGRGGTTFGPVVEMYNKGKRVYSVLIYFTDGEAPVPNPLPEKQMYWLLSSQGMEEEAMSHFPGGKIKIQQPLSKSEQK